jgi:hypothetical protein
MTHHPEPLESRPEISAPSDIAAPSEPVLAQWDRQALLVALRPWARALLDAAWDVHGRLDTPDVPRRAAHPPATGRPEEP